MCSQFIWLVNEDYDVEYLFMDKLCGNMGFEKESPKTNTI